MTASDSANALFAIAADFIQQTARSVFLTGKAGTGKTTFLKYICDNTDKNFVVAAPTGVAAINAGGVTLHSLFQLPFGVYVPGHHAHNDNIQVTNRNTLFKNLQFTKNKRELLQELELLIIDEVSMVRCDMLDAIDAILKYVRRNQMPFGGVQVLFIGDLYQLSPVAKSDEWNILQEHYESPFFFHAKALQQNPPLCIELKKIYRQNEQVFIDLLNNIRNNDVTKEDLSLLGTRQVRIENPEGYITLTTHNDKANAINNRELDKLPGKAFQFSATVEREFSDRNYPTDPMLLLKKDARIMFIKNDASEDKKYFNGKIATIVEIDEEDITVQFDDGDTFELTRDIWRNIRYNYNTEADKIEEEELGSFTQYPIRLAWAITIHKSQGLTFQKAIIDAGSSFAPGQVYVALSRCTSLQGVVLQSPITQAQIKTDSHVLAYSKQLHNELELTDLLQQEKSEYEKQFFVRLFDFTKLHTAIVDWHTSISEKKLPVLKSTLALSIQLVEKSAALQDTAGKTQVWIERQFTKARLENTYDTLLGGLKKSVAHFNTTLHDDFFVLLRDCHTTLQHKSKAKKYIKSIAELAGTIAAKAKRLRETNWRETALYEGEKTSFDELETTSAKAEKGSSARESFVLFQQTPDIQKIADLRGLAVSTIEGHLVQFVKSGELTVEKLVAPEKIKMITETIHKSNVTRSSEIKAVLGEDYSYNEIRAVLYHIEQLKQSVEPS